MRISVIAVGTRMPSWVEAGIDEYRKRLPPDLGFAIRELPLARRPRNQNADRAVQAEGEAMLAAIPAGDRAIALDVAGRTVSTEKLAQSLAQWRLEGVNVSLLVGGPDGLSRACLQRADERWSLSAMTLPHPLVRILVAEQLYRAWTILNNHPYHR